MNISGRQPTFGSSDFSDLSFRSVESIEADAWLEIQANVPRPFRDRLDLRVGRVAGAVTVLSPTEDIASFNRVWLPGEATVATCDELEEIRAYARSLGKHRFIAHCPPWAASPALFLTHGFRQRPGMMKLARRPAIDVPKTALRVEHIGSDQSDLFGRLCASANESEEWMSDGFRATIGFSGWTHYVVYDGEIPIAAAGLRVDRGYAWLWSAATLPAFRGRGAQLALLHRRIHDASKAGCEWIVGEALLDSTSLRNQQRAGFKVVYERPNYVADLTISPT